jgi:hypothetical protein
METAILILIGITVLGFIIWRLVKAGKNPSCDCGCGSKEKGRCSACQTKEKAGKDSFQSME